MPFLYTGSRASAASSTASACNGARLLRCQHLRSCLLLCRQCAPCNPALQGERQPLVCARTGGFDGCADFWRTARTCPRVPPGIRESIRHFAVQRHCSGAAARKEEPRGKYAPLLAQRLGRILHIPVIQPLCLTRQVLPQNRWTSKSALPMSRMLTPAVLGLIFPECGCCCWMM